jgi:hypothetical protein
LLATVLANTVATTGAINLTFLFVSYGSTGISVCASLQSNMVIESSFERVCFAHSRRRRSISDAWVFLCIAVVQHGQDGIRGAKGSNGHLKFPSERPKNQSANIPPESELLIIIFSRAPSKLVHIVAHVAMDCQCSLQTFHPCDRPEWWELNALLPGDFAQWQIAT